MLGYTAVIFRDCKYSKDADKLPGWAIFLVGLVVVLAAGLLGFVAVLVSASHCTLK